MVESFELRIPVEPEDIDELGHVNNVVYLRWVQDVAVAHWEAEASPEERASLSWVVTRHEIDYLLPAWPDDDLVARTWVGRSSRRRFDRHTEVRRLKDDRLLARVRSVWCPVDRSSGRPTRVSDEVRDRWSAPDPTAS